MAVYKEVEFKTFLKLIESGQVHYWLQIANIVGVDKNTITAWKKLPEAQNAILKGLSDSLSKMEEAGKKDWRMWEARLKLLGLSGKIEIETEIKLDPAEEILKKYGLLDENGNQTDIA